MADTVKHVLKQSMSRSSEIFLHLVFNSYVY